MFNLQNPSFLFFYFTKTSTFLYLNTILLLLVVDLRLRLQPSFLSLSHFGHSSILTVYVCQSST
ncbi:unnamed protein product [Meloidogyne enterolobii]|uniref:Uncharacterized protein n=1 Tax=Meloidogyne enterolobii TaxID=390850 RepID=A0ACB1A0C9_MELEN